jgi:hypothetical protein
VAASNEGLVTSECACEPPRKEDNMGKSIHGVLARLLRWLNRHHLFLVLLLSALHLGLAHMHVRDSGRTDHRLLLGRVAI